MFKWLAVSLLALALAPAAQATPTIYVTNQSSTIPDAAIVDALPAFQASITLDLAPAWNVNGTLVFNQHPPARSWQIHVLDGSLLACWGCAGYHTVNSGTPIAMVGTGTGIPWQEVFSHELDEMLVDPWVNRAAFIPRYHDPETVFWIVEVADAVERTHYSYNRPSASGLPVILSDFVLPSWYSGLPGKRDFMGYVKRAHEVLPGGYSQAFRLGWWQEISYFVPR